MHTLMICFIFPDINECVENPSVCSHQCRNVKGSYKCVCPRGYVLLEDGRTCSGVYCFQILFGNKEVLFIIDLPSTIPSLILFKLRKMVLIKIHNLQGNFS